MKKILLSFVLFCFVTNCYSQKSESTSWYVEGYSEEIAMNYFRNSTLLEPIEGIWQSSDGFKYAIERDVEGGRRISQKYRVIVLASSSDGWNLGQIKGFITPGSVDKIYSFKYYTRSYYGTESQNVLLVLENPLVITFQRVDNGREVTMLRLYPKYDSDSQNPQSTPSGVKWTGSGIVIGDKYIVTNNHVVENAKSLSVSGFNGKSSFTYKVQVIATDKVNDLAIVKVVDENSAVFNNIPYGFNTSTVDVGTEVFSLGYPMTDIMGSEIKVTNGIISSKTGFQGDVSTYQMTAPLQPGNSGGPIFDYNGNLIGISVAQLKNDIAQNVNYAIKLSYLQNLIESCRENIVLSNRNEISSLSLTEKIKAISPYVVMFLANFDNGQGQGGFTTQAPVSKSNKEQAELLKNRAREKYANGDYESAYEDIKESVFLNPTAEAHFMRGFMAFNMDVDTTMAIESFKYCIDKNYELENSRHGLATCYLKQKRYDEAIELFNKVIMDNRKNVLALYNRAYCKGELNDQKGSIADYIQILKYEGLIEFDYATVYNNIAYSYVLLKNFNEAEKYIREALQRNHMIWYIWDTDGELAYKKGEYSRCVSSMSNAITIDNKHDNSYYYRALAKMKMGDMMGAYSDIEILKEIDSIKGDSLIRTVDIEKLAISQTTDNERIILSPKIGLKNKSELTLKAIELTSDYTALHFIYTNKYYYDNGIYVNKDSYIKDSKSHNKHILLKTEKISIDPDNPSIIKGNQKKEFVLYFQKLDPECKSFEFTEDASNGWHINGIKMESSVKK